MHLPVDFDCGCDTRKETIGTDKWWTGVIIVSTITGLALIYGGNVTAQTKNILKIGLAGAAAAILVQKFIDPTIKG